jgi:malate dehydrogenase (oxaloacetate-decarboxylating)
MEAEPPADDAGKKAIRYSAFYGGKVGTSPKVPIRSLSDFSFWYTPGVAAVSEKVKGDADLSFEYTNRWNTVAILTDGTRVLGLGDIGPEAAFPVMEGKALIYKYLGGVDAIPVPIRVSTEEEFVRTAEALEPALGGINLEDISSPKCFDILERLRNEMRIPVWHDDQQGTAGIILAALFNALEVTERRLEDSRLVFLGAGAANVAAARLLMEAGAAPGNIVLVDSKGPLHSEREDVDKLLLRNKWKYDLALRTNASKVKGGLRDALRGADVLIAASTPGPNVVKKEDVMAMNRRAIVFLLANPVPEMWPEDAKTAGAEVVATGRSDFPNQVNNSILFPALFRGALDVRARTITDGMVIKAAKELAAFARGKGLGPANIIPTMLDWDVFPRVAAAVGDEAQNEGIARKSVGRNELLHRAKKIIDESRLVAQVMFENGLILAPPPEWPG